MLWNYLAGYVIIDVKGGGLERFINQLVIERVELWNVRRTPDGIRASVSIPGFYAIRRLARGRALSIRIVNKRGVAVPLKKFRFRRVLLTGWILALAFVLIASRRIWFVRIEGCDRVEEQEILLALEDMGIAPGVTRRGLTTSDIGGALMRSDDRIAWAGAELTGVILSVTVVEAEEPKAALVPDDTPSSIYAARDGVIVSVSAYEGLAAVEPGDVVKAGELLITGDLSTADREGPYTASRGSAIADTVYVFTEERGPTATVPSRTGGYEDHVTLELSGRVIFPVGTEDGAEYETVRCAALRNCFLPLTVRRVREYELSDREIALSNDALRELALSAVEQRLIDEVPHDAVILHKESYTEEIPGGAVRAVLIATIRQDIGEVKAIYDGD